MRRTSLRAKKKRKQGQHDTVPTLQAPQVQAKKMTNGSKIDDRLDQASPDVVGNTVEVEDHPREPSAILLLPANQVPVLILGFLVVRRVGRGGRLGFKARCLQGRPRSGLGGRARRTGGAVLKHLFFKRGGLSVLLLALHGSIGALGLGSSGPER